ncbi:predicted protein [Histoplasma capsulatum G186AR]|uniref:Uncharacterized protein n=1 Tax=Ajellomyces capsulatus (strain G186AR / H82 / ATCC MYA-2454 / RMSCC 2432) TaxID=447093 RepID=C0NFI2_AJECG|nr:uncharacterized protein HCBG_01648 [Histoplasma capsulatum G186AR]EEH10003.1 predicted protein [Histoplasma capsulatum G186AR]
MDPATHCMLFPASDNSYNMMPYILLDNHCTPEGDGEPPKESTLPPTPPHDATRCHQDVKDILTVTSMIDGLGDNVRMRALEPQVQKLWDSNGPIRIMSVTAINPGQCGFKLNSVGIWKAKADVG